MHLFAISGLHVGVVALVVGGLFGILPLPRKLKIIAGLGSVFLYVQITGGQPSAMRAFIMVTCLWGAYFARGKVTLSPRFHLSGNTNDRSVANPQPRLPVLSMGCERNSPLWSTLGRRIEDIFRKRSGTDTGTVNLSM